MGKSTCLRLIRANTVSAVSLREAKGIIQFCKNVAQTVHYCFKSSQELSLEKLFVIQACFGA